MAKLISFASWNVEGFSGRNDARVKRVVKLLKSKKPDVFAIYEVKSKFVFDELMGKMPNYGFTLSETDSPILPNVLVGVRNSIQSFITQRDEFRSKVPSLRPGMLAGLRVGGKDYGFLFLHAKSFQAPRDWGLRDDMFKHVAKLKRALDRKEGPGKKANFLVAGDLNTMGLNAPFNPVSDLDADKEIEFLSKRMGSVKMSRLEKTFEQSWWGGSERTPPSKLDHVFASEHLKFKKFAGGKRVEVIGWPQKQTDAQKRKWIRENSDHALLFGVIEK